METTLQKFITVEQHEEFVLAAMAASGADRDDARTVAKALAWTDLHGRPTQGIVWLPNIIKRLTSGLIASPARMTWTEAGAAAKILDAGNAFGHVAGFAAMQEAVKIASAHGIGFVGVRHSNHYGAAAYYCTNATETGCLAITGTNAIPHVAPHGGARAALGTNPLAFGCPTESGAPILVDFSTSAISGGIVRKNFAEKIPLPAQAAVDADGRLTTDPAAALSGCLLPAAGPKGFGLALMIEILSGLLTGSAVGKEVGSMLKTWDRPVDTGHFFIAVNIERFMPRQAFLERVRSLLSWIAETPVQPGVDEILYPGQTRSRIAAKYAQEGIPLSQETVQSVEQLADSLHIPLPWRD